MSTLRLAIIGGGHLGRIHAKLAKSNDQFDVVGVVDPSSETRQMISQQFELATFGDYRELLGKIDAAVVAAPTTAHYEIATDLLRAGAHVFVEKPLASSPDQARRLCQIATHHGRVLQTGHVERFNPTWTTAGPHLGKPKFIEAIRAGSYSGRSTDIGVIMDLMIHDIDLILSLDQSPVEKIHASGIALLGSHEDVAEARIEFASGLVANLRASRLATSSTRRMQLFTTESYVEIDFSAESVQVIRPSSDVLARCVALDELPDSERMEAKNHIFDNLLHCERLMAPGRNAILDEHNDFALSIQTGASPSVTGEDGARAVELASQIVEAIAQRQWDGRESKSWRTGALASIEPKILSLPGVIEKLDASEKHQMASQSGRKLPLRRAG